MSGLGIVKYSVFRSHRLNVIAFYLFVCEYNSFSPAEKVADDLSWY